MALRHTRWQIRKDVEWPLEHPVSGLGSRLRPDASVLDPDAPAGAARLITVEVLADSDRQRLVASEPESRIEGKRRAYAYGGVSVHLEVEPVDETVEVRAYSNRDGTLELTATARGDEPLVLDEPVLLELVPSELEGWLRRYLQSVEDAIAKERARLEQERARLQLECARAEAAEERAARAETAVREATDRPS